MSWLEPLTDAEGPFASVCLDVSRTDEHAAHAIATTWQELREQLSTAGATEALVESIGAALDTGTKMPGKVGRAVISGPGGVLLDRTQAIPPPAPRAMFGAAPALLEVVRDAGTQLDALQVVVDRRGADLTWTGPEDSSGRRRSTSVEGGHDELAKPSTGGTNERRLEARAEDSWERNAATVAAEVDRWVAEARPDVVVLSGDVRAVALVRDALGGAARTLLVEVSGGTRSAGGDATEFAGNVADALDVVRRQRQEEVIDRFRQQHGRDEGGVTSLEDVVEVLRRGQVQDLLITDVDGGVPLADRTLRIGSAPLELGVRADDLVAVGVSGGGIEFPAGDALVWAAVGQNARVWFVAPDAVELADGVGAVLRWWDQSTPSESAVSMSGDIDRIRDTP